LGLRAAVVRFAENSTQYNIEREAIPMLGLRGASLSSITFKDYPISPGDLIGEHLSPMRRGMVPLLHTFNKMRICIAALAVGQSQAICDYIVANRSHLSHKEAAVLGSYQNRLDVIRQRVFQVAWELNHKPDQTAQVSLLKGLATTLIEEIVANMFSFFNQAAFFEHPFLAKSYRDAFAYEGYKDGLLAKYY
jgi:alkylation response protein AidB-like acyl-CoA dehydrogenase